jgi:hypothetical protein
MASNWFRGALGMKLEEAVFRPHAEDGPSGLRDAPRPFVFRTHRLDGADITPGNRFGAVVHAFSTDAARAITRAMGELDRPIILHAVEREDFPISLAPPDSAPPRVRIYFDTATELKGWETGRGFPPFAVVFGRLRDRISALHTLYWGGELDLDWRAMGVRAATVQFLGGDLGRVRAERVSGRTWQRHPLGGFTGWVEYGGDLREFLPWLRAGELTGVGRQTVWGKGAIRVAAATSGTAAG